MRGVQGGFRFILSDETHTNKGHGDTVAFARRG
jgi:hypothetical protein